MSPVLSSPGYIWFCNSPFWRFLLGRTGIIVFLVSALRCPWLVLALPFFGWWGFAIAPPRCDSSWLLFCAAAYFRFLSFCSLFYTASYVSISLLIFGEVFSQVTTFLTLLLRPVVASSGPVCFATCTARCNLHFRVSPGYPRPLSCLALRSSSLLALTEPPNFFAFALTPFFFTTC